MTICPLNHRAVNVHKCERGDATGSEKCWTDIAPI